MSEKNYTVGAEMITREQLRTRVEELGAEISKDYEGERVIVVGILRGAVLFMSDLIREIDADVVIDFMAVSSYGAATKSSGAVRILKDLEVVIENEHVIIVEDIVDTGLTLKYLKENLLAREPKSLKVCTLLDKPERREVNVQADYTGFTIENKFIVGYGLDFNQRYRNLPYISYLEEA